MDSRRDKELAAAAHGAMFALHGVAVWWNAQRGNRFDVAMHLIFLVYDMTAFHKHLHALDKSSRQ